MFKRDSLSRWLLFVTLEVAIVVFFVASYVEQMGKEPVREIKSGPVMLDDGSFLKIIGDEVERVYPLEIIPRGHSGHYYIRDGFQIVDIGT